jgi:tetratricopeptide (TPR) repeat protein
VKRVAFLALLTACAETRPAPPPPAPTSAPQPVITASATAVPETPRETRIVFIEDNYGQALAEARAKRRPIFVDTWAPWCHTCMSLKSYVLPSEELKKLAGDFVWLSIDSEKAENAEFLSRFTNNVLPTLWVIDPTKEQAMLRWGGTVTAPELVGMLEDVKGTAGSGEAAAHYLAGNQASAKGQLRDAIAEYRQALKTAPEGWARRGQVVDALTTRLGETKEDAACAELAATEAPKLTGTALANVLQTGLSCTFRLPKNARAPGMAQKLVSLGKQTAQNLSIAMLADDRSGLYEHVVAAVRELGDDAEAMRIARDWASFLEEEARKAPTPQARAVFDPHRLGAYIELGEAQKAIPMLEQSEKEMPDDYNPPARLARAYFELKKWDTSIAAADRALQKAYGPRKLRIFSLKADALLKKGDRAAAKKTLAAALAHAQSIPLPGSYPRLRDELARRYDQL